VVDRGNPDAPILAVGEAPGSAEDASGIAFCGRAGAMLDRLFASAGLSTEEDLLIVNVVKCRPPGNRDPRPAETAACRPFFDRQLDFSPARLVALLGRTALRHLDPERARRPLGEQVGRFFELAGHPGPDFAVLYPPAALLYNRKLEPVARRHIQALARRASRQFWKSERRGLSSRITRQFPACRPPGASPPVRRRSARRTASAAAFA